VKGRRIDPSRFGIPSHIPHIPHRGCKQSLEPCSQDQEVTSQAKSAWSQRSSSHTNHLACHIFSFVGVVYQGKHIVFGFIIEYSSLRNFGPQVVGLFLYEDFWKVIFLLVLKLEISYRVMISWKILVSCRGFFEDYIFAWWNTWVSIILLLP
jgi:hypothetical protein